VGVVVLLLLTGAFTWLYATRRSGEWEAPEDPPRPPATNEVHGALEAVGPALRGLAADVRDEEEAARRAAARVEAALVEAAARGGRGGPGTPELAAALEGALASSDWGVRWAGALGVPRLGPVRGALARALAANLRAETHEPVRVASAHALAFVADDFAADALPALVEAAAGEGEATAQAALETIAQRASAALPAANDVLLRGLGRPTAASREAAARALSSAPWPRAADEESRRRIGDALAGAVGDRSPAVRLHATAALARLGPDGAPWLAALLAALRDDSPLVRDQAAVALGQVGEAALPALEAALDPSSGTRPAVVAWALRLVGDAAVPALSRALRSADPIVRAHAALALVEMRAEEEAVLACLLDLLEGGEGEARILAARGVGRMGVRARDAEDALRALLQHPDEDLARAAAAALPLLSPRRPR
jgi:HEAT repeat protein